MGTLQKMQALWIFSENLFLLHAGFVENHHNAPTISTELQFPTLPADSSFAFLSQQTLQTASFLVGETGHEGGVWKSLSSCWRAGERGKSSRRDVGTRGCCMRTGNAGWSVNDSSRLKAAPSWAASGLSCRKRWVLQWYLALACLAVEKLEKVGVCRRTSENPTSPFLLVLCLLVT